MHTGCAVTKIKTLPQRWFCTVIRCQAHLSFYFYFTIYFGAQSSAFFRC